MMAFFAPKVSLFQLSTSGSSWVSLGSSGYLIMARSPNPDHPASSGQHLHRNISETLNSDEYCRSNKLDYTTIEVMWWDIALLSRNKHLHYSIKYGFKKKGDSAVVTKAVNMRTLKTEIIAIRFGSNDRSRICQQFRSTFWCILEDLSEDKKTMFGGEGALEHWSCAACDHSRNRGLDGRCTQCHAVRPSPYHIIRDHVVEYDEDRRGGDGPTKRERENAQEKGSGDAVKRRERERLKTKRKYDPFYDDDDDEEEETADSEQCGDDESGHSEDGDELQLRFDWVCPSCTHRHDKQWNNKEANRCDECFAECPFIMDQCTHCREFLYLGMHQ